MRPLALAIALALCPGVLLASDLPALYSVTDVAADDVLNVREGPSADAPVIGELTPTQSDIEVVAITDGWGQINLSGESSGYAAMRYLAPIGGPDWTDPDANLECGGTEPFWNLTQSADHSSVKFELMGNDPLEFPVTHRGAALGSNHFTGFGLGGDQGFATLVAAECSDGMSDRAFGIEMILFLKDSGGYRGCCSLLP